MLALLTLSLLIKAGTKVRDHCVVKSSHCAVWSIYLILVSQGSKARANTITYFFHFVPVIKSLLEGSPEAER